MKRYLFFIAIQFAVLVTLHGQWLEVTFCGATTKVEPVKDAQGNDQRHKGALMLKYIHVKTFGSKSRIVYNIGTTSSDLPIDEKVYLDDCFNNNIKTNCNNCGVCRQPTSNGRPFGRIIAESDYTGSIRVRGKDGGLLIESTGYTNQVCYTTPGLDMSNYQKRPMSLEVAFEGSKDGDFKSKGVEVSYTINHGTKKWLKRLNNTVGEHVFKLSRTDAMISNGVIDLHPIKDLHLNSNLVENELILEYRVNQTAMFHTSIWSMDGNQWQEKTVQLTPSREIHSISLDVSSLPGGSYILLVKDSNGYSHPFKFVKS